MATHSTMKRFQFTTTLNYAHGFFGLGLMGIVVFSAVHCAKINDKT